MQAKAGKGELEEEGMAKEDGGGRWRKRNEEGRVRVRGDC